jgi:DNA-binding SARP family transcriptional activator
MLTQCSESEKESGQPVTFRVLGPVGAYRDGTILRLGGEKQITVLAALLIEHERVVTDSTLICLLWGEKPPRTADAQLYTYVSRLRRRFPGAAAFHRIGSGYSMVLDNSSLDYDQFCHLSKMGMSQVKSGDYSVAANHLSGALELWRGPSLSNVTVFFSDLYQPSLEQCRMSVLENRIEADLALGRHAEILGELYELSVRYPLCEMFRDQLMRALCRCGRKSDAIRAYHEVRHLLAEELGVDPDAKLQQTFEAVIRGEERLIPLGGTGL